MSVDLHALKSGLSKDFIDKPMKSTGWELCVAPMIDGTDCKCYAFANKALHLAARNMLHRL